MSCMRRFDYYDTVGPQGHPESQLFPQALFTQVVKPTRKLGQAIPNRAALWIKTRLVNLHT